MVFPVWDPSRTACVPLVAGLSAPAGSSSREAGARSPRILSPGTLHPAPAPREPTPGRSQGSGAHLLHQPRAVCDAAHGGAAAAPQAGGHAVRRLRLRWAAGVGSLSGRRHGRNSLKSRSAAPTSHTRGRETLLQHRGAGRGAPHRAPESLRACGTPAHGPSLLWAGCAWGQPWRPGRARDARRRRAGCSEKQRDCGK